MGLLDILNGMQNGPGGQRQPVPQGQQGGGMSPIMMALLGLLAYKAMKGGGLGNTLGGGQTGAPQPAPSSGGGGLGDILGGILGGGRSMPAGLPGGAPGGGGLGDILGGILGGQQPGGAARGAGPSGGGLGDILGGMLGGRATGAVLSGGLGQVLNDLQRSGHGQTAQSWIGRGENEPIQPNELRNALGADTIQALSQQTGIPQDELVHGLSKNLPDFVDQLTPEGRLPTDDEAAKW
jgi:uncharacterized protein YidB (DUF937 family)